MVRELVQRFDAEERNRRLPLLAVGVATVILVLGLAWWGSRPEWVILAQGGEPDTIGQIAERLDDEGIAYRLNARGTGLSVQEDHLARARVALARGGLPTQGRPGFELFDQPTWGMTDFTQRIHYRRALEGELERTISRMRGVETAQVHLGIQESAVLRRTGRGAEASVVVTLVGGQSPDRGFAQGIASLVAGSVDGLEPDRVRVLDDAGRLLSENGDDDGLDGVADRQLRIRLEVERHLQRKAEELLVAVVGEGNVSVRVSADLDFDRLERTVRAVDPEQQVTLTDSRAEITPGVPEQGAAQLTTSTTYEPTRSVESFARSGARIERLNVAVLVGHRLVPGANGTVNQEPLTADEMERLEALVAQAVGLFPDRGDGISVMNLPFVGLDAPLAAPPAPPGVLDILERFQRPILGLLGLLLATGLGFGMLRSLSASGRTEAEGAEASGRSLPAGAPVPSDGGESAAAAPAAPVSAAPPRVRAAPAPAVAVDDPELTARLVRSWMREN
jgi:flagellar M-ring protein FliF